MDFLRAGSGGPFPIAADGTRHGAAVPLLGISVGAGCVCVGSTGADGEFVAGPAGTVDDWAAADRGGVAVLPLVGAENGGCIRLSMRHVHLFQALQGSAKAQGKTRKNYPVEHHHSEPSSFNEEGNLRVNHK